MQGFGVGLGGKPEPARQQEGAAEQSCANRGAPHIASNKRKATPPAAAAKPPPRPRRITLRRFVGPCRLLAAAAAPPAAGRASSEGGHGPCCCACCGRGGLCWPHNAARLGLEVLKDAPCRGRLLLLLLPGRRLAAGSWRGWLLVGDVLGAGTSIRQRLWVKGRGGKCSSPYLPPYSKGKRAHHCKETAQALNPESRPPNRRPPF